MKPDIAKTQNITVGASFGMEREAAFEHAKEQALNFISLFYKKQIKSILKDKSDTCCTAIQWLDLHFWQGSKCHLATRNASDSPKSGQRRRAHFNHRLGLG